MFTETITRFRSPNEVESKRFKADCTEIDRFKSHHKNSAPKSIGNNKTVMTVFEHQRLMISDFSQACDFNWLLTQEFVVFSLKRQSGQWQLKVGHYIGIIVLPSGITLEILPKPVNKSSNNNSSQKSNDIAITRLWVQQMLSDLFHVDSDRRPHYKTLDQLSSDVDPLAALPRQTLPISEWLVQQFLQLIALYRPTQEYQTTVQNNFSLQGKLLIKEQLRRNKAQPHKFVSEEHHLNQDTLSNRLIKSALILLEPLLVQSASLQHANLSTLLSAKSLAAWRAVSALTIHELRQLDSIYQRARRQLNIQPLMRSQLQTAQQLLYWAYWLLSRQQASLLTGSSLKLSRNALNKNLDYKGTALNPPKLCILFNMNQAFEQWVSLRITKSFTQLDKGYQVLYQSQHSWLRDQCGQNCLSIRPDLLIGQNASYSDEDTQNSGRYSHVIDIKWKALAQASAISASDAYQLISYAQAYQVSQVWLVYPVSDETRQPMTLQQHPLVKTTEPLNDVQLWLMPFNVLTGTLNDRQAVTKQRAAKVTV